MELAEAPSFGQTIFDYEPRCAGANDYRKLVESILAADPASQSTAEVELKVTSEPAINDVS